MIRPYAKVMAKAAMEALRSELNRKFKEFNFLLDQPTSEFLGGRPRKLAQISAILDRHNELVMAIREIEAHS